MANTIHCNNLGACEICGNCLEKKHPWYFCANDNDNFGEISYPEDCDDYVELDDEDEIDDDDDFDPNESIECPVWGSDAYWEGSCYECDQCGWCGTPDDD
jgi:hypothetical protein